ncbi:MAG: helix-turn-helix transcriptional regulator [Clostridia bacterium]|nr:helix-turn-helix transcriptional regulator [Clostridia bacterium]
METAYTPKRAEQLKKMNFPETELSVPTKILWLEMLNAEEITQYHYSGVHSHSFWEVHFVFAGTLTYECDGEEWEITAGNGLFLPAGFQHQFVKCTPDVVKASLAVASGVFAGVGARIVPLPQKIFALMGFILNECENSDVLTPGIISGRILEMISVLAQSLDAELPREQEKMDPRFLVAVEYIEKKRGQTVNCEDVAKECCLSSKQISRIFKNCTGHSLFDYIVNKRIRYAKELLTETDRSIKEVSFAMGFDNESGFISFFKRHTGMSPGAYRKEKRN